MTGAPPLLQGPLVPVSGTPPAAPVGAVAPYAGPLYNPKGRGSQTSDSRYFWINQRLAFAGWLVCDGRPLWVAKYVDLFRVIGTLYGGSGGTFNLPDYRGQFMRGTDLGRGFDPDVGDRTDNVGTTQDMMVQMHEHHYQATSAAATSEEGDIAATAGGQATTTDLLKTDETTLSGSETRPPNIYVNYLIKYATDPARLVAIGIDENPPGGADHSTSQK